MSTQLIKPNYLTNVNTTRACSHRLAPNVFMSFLMVLASSSLNLLEVISVQNRNESTVFFLFLKSDENIFRRSQYHLPILGCRVGLLSSRCSFILMIMIIYRGMQICWSFVKLRQNSPGIRANERVSANFDI